METEIGRYNLEDLHDLLGKRVRKSELSNIYDVCIVIQKAQLLDDHDIEGILKYYGSENTDEYQNFFMQSEPMTLIYFYSSELVDGIFLDE